MQYIQFFLPISGFVCGSCHLQQYNLIKDELPLAKPGLQRRKHDAGNQIPDKLKLKNHVNPLSHVQNVTEVMDLSYSARELAETSMTPPKKRRFAQQICDTSNNSPIIKHVTLPPR